VKVSFIFLLVWLWVWVRFVVVLISHSQGRLKAPIHTEGPHSQVRLGVSVAILFVLDCS
jgi:hypothetical protein